MSVRTDLKDVEGLISRLISIGEEFKSKDNWWSHLKNKEDWERCVWSIDDGQQKAKIERVYCDGRDMGLFMSDALISINFDITTYPTLTKIIERFNGTWVYSDLEPILQEAIKAHDLLDRNCWAFEQMVSIFKDQIGLAKVVEQTLNLLKNTDLYKYENGIPVEKETPSININNVSNSNIAVSSENIEQRITNNEHVFNEIIEVVNTSNIENKEPLITAIEEMQNAQTSEVLSDAYKRFIAVAANHMTIVAPFIPALTALL